MSARKHPFADNIGQPFWIRCDESTIDRVRDMLDINLRTLTFIELGEIVGDIDRLCDLIEWLAMPRRTDLTLHFSQAMLADATRAFLRAHNDRWPAKQFALGIPILDQSGLGTAQATTSTDSKA